MKTLAYLTVALACGPVTQIPETGLARRDYATSVLSGDRLEHRFVRWGDAILIEDVMVNGKGPFRFLLDTGAEGAGRVDKSLVDALQLPSAGTMGNVGLFGETREMTRYQLDSLTIGSLSFKELTMSGRDYNAEIKGPGMRPIHGILGFHLFSEYLLNINYPARMVTITKGELPPPDGESILPFISDDEDPEVQVHVGDRKVRALIDTGAMGHLAVPGWLAKKLKFTSEPTLKGKDGKNEVHSGTLDGAVRIGTVEFTNPQTLIVGSLTQVVVGVRLLASLDLTFDQKNGRVRVERPAERKRYGITLGMRGAGPWEFKGVEAGSIAEAAGLRDTDWIVTVNGQAFGEIDREDGFRFLDTSPLLLEIERDGSRREIRMSLE